MGRSTRRRKRKSVSQQRNSSNRIELGYDSLEHRLALTTFVVTSLGDSIAADGEVTLREAVQAANTNLASGDAVAGDTNGDVILFDSSLGGGTINLTQGPLDISDDLAIQAGNRNITVDGQDLSRVFEIASSEKVTLGRLNVTGGNAAIGGGVLATGSGNVLIFGGEYSNNVATGDGGGAIYSGGGNLFIAGDAVFDGNVANGAAGSGGAIFDAGGLAAFRDATFTSNVANRAGGAIEIDGGDLFLTDVLFGNSFRNEGVGNIAGPSGTATPGNGGALHVSEGDIVAMTHTNFVGNVAAGDGGGVWNQGGTAMYINGTVFENNSAAGDEADDGGGAIFNNGGALFVNGGQFFENAATGTAGSGGGILSTDGLILVQLDSIFASNRSSSAGGAVKIIDGEYFDLDSLYRDNDAGVSQQAFPSQTSLAGNGGAFHVTGSATTAFNGTEFLRNLAGGEGGAVWNSAGSDMFLTNVAINKNVASGDDSDSGGGGIFNDGGNVYVKGATISGNLANGASGSGGGALSTDGLLRFDNSAIFGNRAARAGGGVEVITGRAAFNTVTIDSNTTGLLLTANPGNGGGIHVTGAGPSDSLQAEVTFNDSTISNNRASNQGGGLWNGVSNAIFFDDETLVSGNWSGGNGGGAWNNGLLFASSTEFSLNHSQSNGGAVYNGGVLSALTGTVFDGNTSQADGGAIFNHIAAQTRITTNVILRNNSADRGGAVFNNDNGRADISSTVFLNNIASTDGGAIFTSNQGLTFESNNSFAGNVPNDKNV